MAMPSFVSKQERECLLRGYPIDHVIDEIPCPTCRVTILVPKRICRVCREFQIQLCWQWSYRISQAKK